MSFLSIIIALLLEQVRPIGRHHPLRVALPEFIQAVRSNFDAGQRRHAYWVWILLVLVPTLCAFLLHLLITHFLAEKIRSNQKVSSWLQKIAGLFLVGFGLKLALSKF